MLGKLTLDALPFYSWIATAGALATVLGGLAVVGAITWLGWRYVWNEWLTSVDHKRIGVMYVMLAMVILVRGFIDAFMMRSQQAIALNSNGYLPPNHYDQIFSSHGTMMIFFMAMPFLTGLINIVVPQQIGARDVAFPFLNSVSLWLTMAGAGLVLVSLVIGTFSTAGWTGYPPYSELAFNPGVGVDYWLWSILISGIGTTLTGINFIVTILKRRAPGMTLMRMPLFTWTALCTSVLMTFAFPALTAVCAMLALDRLLGMHFFTNDGGGNMMNYVNLFWIWGHPEVYILVLPAFGIFSEVVATFSRKRLFGYASMVYATMAIALLSFVVWLHHFFTMGSSADVNAFFGLSTMVIAVPTGVKVFDWLLTMYRGRITFHPAMLWTVGFIVTFVIGGMTGVLLAIPPADYLMHNTTFLVAHFHNMLVPGALFGYLAGYMYWFPKVFGFTVAFVDYSNTLMGAVAEVSVDHSTGQIKAHNFWCAADCGIPVQPDNVVAQFEGGIVYGLGLALTEEISIKDGAVEQSNFYDYTVMRMSDLPDIHVELIATDNHPTGVGQMPVTVVAPAISNAVARLTGVRLRETPMTPERVKKALG
jgi:cytochrome o ubiquinol oxidase subunit I